MGEAVGYTQNSVPNKVYSRKGPVCSYSVHLLGRNHKELRCVFAGYGDLVAQALLSHFESSVHAALKLPK